jgi:hypothetical protein
VAGLRNEGALAWLVESARWEDVRLTSLFGGGADGTPDPRNGVAELFENDTEGVVGLMDEAGLALNDEIVEMRFSHEDLFKLSKSLLSAEGNAS